MFPRTVTASLLILAAGFPAPLHAFQGHVPFAWWSMSSDSPVGTSHNFLEADKVQEVSTSFIDKCPKAVVLFDHSGLHADDFGRLDETSTFKILAKQAVASLRVQYVPGVVDVNKLVSRIKKDCDADSTEIDISESREFPFKYKDRTQIVVVRSEAEELSGINDAAHQVLESVESVVANEYSVVLTSSRAAATHFAGQKRATPEDSPELAKRAVGAAAPGLPTVTSNGGLFGFFVIFGPGIWMGFFAMSIFMPAILSAIVLMSGVQTPIRFEKKPKNIK